MAGGRKNELTNKQARFCEEYMKDLNTSAAARRAGYSPSVSGKQGPRLLTYPHVQDELARLKKKISDKNEGLAQQVIDELKKIAFSNVQDYIAGGNSIVDLSELKAEKTAAVSAIKKSTTTFGTEDNGGIKETIEFKLWDKGNALERLGRHLGIFEADNKQKGPVVIKVTDIDE